MTKSIQVTDEVHKKLMKLKGYFEKSSLTDTIDELLKYMGYGDDFFRRMDVLIERKRRG